MPFLHRLGAAFLTAIVVAPAIAWVIALEAGVIAASREFLIASLAAFVAALISSPNHRSGPFGHIVRATPVVLLTIFAVSTFRAFWSENGDWQRDFVSLLPIAVCTILLVALLYWRAARASIDAARKPAKTSGRAAVQGSLGERFTISLWWSMSTVVCVWLPTLALFRIAEFGFGLSPTTAFENAIIFVLTGMSAIAVFVAGMLGLLPGSTSKID